MSSPFSNNNPATTGYHFSSSSAYSSSSNKNDNFNGNNFSNNNNYNCQGCFGFASSSPTTSSMSSSGADSIWTSTMTKQTSTQGIDFDSNNNNAAVAGNPERSRRRSRKQQQTSSSVAINIATPTAIGGEGNDETSSILVRELNELTFQERERVYEDVHGVATLTEETPEFIKGKIQELQTELAKLSRPKRKALERAIFLKPSLGQDEKVMKMFLRADSYDAKLAAERMALHYTHKLELFGDEKLAKDITLDDMDEDDMESINTGSFHIMKEKDRAGRSVWFLTQMHYRYKHWQNQIRYTWYQVMSTLEDEEAQIRGVVDIVYCVGLSAMEATFSQLMSKGGNIITNLPYRLSALHFCYSDRRLQPALSVIQMIVKRQMRLRFRTHFGSHVEVRYALMTFGIPMGIGSIPVLNNDELIPEMNQRYLQERRAIEKQRKLEKERQYQQSKIEKDQENDYSNDDNNKKTDIQEKFYIDYPNPMDVLLGRGRPFQSFSGNQHLMLLVEQRRAEYQQVDDRFEKTFISMEIVKYIQSKGGRFLQRVPNLGWEEIDTLLARDKVSHTFRTKTTNMANTDNNTTTTNVAVGGKDKQGQSVQKNPDNIGNDNYEYDDIQETTNKKTKRIRYDDTVLENNEY